MPGDPIRTLQHPAVRDLAWAIGSPGLLDTNHPAYRGQVVPDEWNQQQLQAASNWLHQLDQAPQPLLDFLAARPTRRLGHYFESLIMFWLGHVPGMEIIATNLQVQNPHQTVGEYDLLYRNDRGETCHWEMAVKFYLQSKPGPEPHYCIGPGMRDRLDLKLQQVFQRQLRLSQTEYGRAALPPGLQVERALAFIKGYLFYHAQLPHPQPVQGIASGHLHGWWLCHGEAPLPQTANASRWVLPQRLHWMAPQRLQPDAPSLDSTMLDEHLRQHFAVQDDALLVVELQQEADGYWHEVARGFVVHRGWPKAQP